MKNVQVIDGADNCTYDIFQISNVDFNEIFPEGQDVEFVNDFTKRVGKARAKKNLDRMWKRPIDKKTISGLHGTLFFELDFKKKFYPTKRETEMVVAFD